MDKKITEIDSENGEIKMGEGAFAIILTPKDDKTFELHAYAPPGYKDDDSSILKVWRGAMWMVDNYPKDLIDLADAVKIWIDRGLGKITLTKDTPTQGNA